MNVSGILVSALPSHVAELVDALARLPLTEVAQVDAPGGRIVVVQERESVAQEFDGLRAIQRLPHVLSADLVMHYFGDDAQPAVLAADEVARRL
jgi:nitrate reductase NapAB chaperone NapD